MLTAGHILFPESKLDSSGVKYFITHELFHRRYTDPEIKTLADEAFQVIFNDGEMRFQLRIMFQNSAYWNVHFTNPDEFWAQYFYPSFQDSHYKNEWAELKRMMQRLIATKSADANLVERCLTRLSEKELPRVQRDADELYAQLRGALNEKPQMAKVIMPDGAMAAIDAAEISNSNQKGGIDFNPDKLELKIQNNGTQIVFHIDPATLQRMQNASGVLPVIIGIQSLKSLTEFMGVPTS